MASPAHVDPEIPVEDPARRGIPCKQSAELKLPLLHPLIRLIRGELPRRRGIVGDALVEIDERAFDDGRSLSPNAGESDETQILPVLSRKEHGHLGELRRRRERIDAALVLLFLIEAVTAYDDIDSLERWENLDEPLPPHMGEQYDAVAFPSHSFESLASLECRIANLDAIDLAGLLAEERDDAHLRAADPFDHERRKHARSILIEVRADDRESRFRVRSERADAVVQLSLADRDRVEARLDHRPDEKPAPVHFDDTRSPGKIPRRKEKEPGIERSPLPDRGGPPGHAARGALPSAGGNDKAPLVPREEDRQARILAASCRRERDEPRYHETRDVLHDGTIA
ncbi:MAG: hypothetical protein NTW97_04615 [Candidatus Krumholzibacteria bacterium]|nr:hypothetical protein [Candidatus Krumholzibacteria bacterium]